jgi:hypothetical protein
LRLQELLLAGNEITDVGGKALALSLRVNNTLKGSFSDLDDLSVLEMASPSPSLLRAVLSLADNPVGDQTATALAQALQTNTSLRELGLRGA